MNVLFIYSVSLPFSEVQPLGMQDELQMGISYISAVLRQNGHKTKLLVLSKESDFSGIDARMKEFAPGLVCFTAVATEYPFIDSVARYVRKGYPGVFLVIGGVHVSLNARDEMLDVFDAVCIGEGEFPVLEAISSLEAGKKPIDVLNLWVKDSGAVRKNPVRPFLQDLDSLPFPDREMWQEFIEKPISRHAVLLGRGCPFNCTYCCNHALRKIASGKYVRLRSPGNVVSEIRGLMDVFPGIAEIYLEVETFGAARMEWVRELCHGLKKFNDSLAYPVEFGVNLRVERYRPEAKEFFTLLRQTNFDYVNIGLESGSHRIRKDVLNRIYSNDDIISTVRVARECGLRVRFFNLIGLPGETEADFMETIEVNRVCQPDFNYLSIFYPYPGTELHRVCLENGIINNIDVDVERVNAAIDSAQFTKKKIERGFIWFDYLVYRGNKPTMALLGDVFGRYFTVYAGKGKVDIFRMFATDTVLRIFKDLDYRLAAVCIEVAVRKVWSIFMMSGRRKAC